MFLFTGYEDDSKYIVPETPTFHEAKPGEIVAVEEGTTK